MTEAETQLQLLVLPASMASMLYSCLDLIQEDPTRMKEGGTGGPGILPTHTFVSMGISYSCTRSRRGGVTSS